MKDGKPAHIGELVQDAPTGMHQGIEAYAIIPLLVSDGTQHDMTYMLVQIDPQYLMQAKGNMDAYNMGRQQPRMQGGTNHYTMKGHNPGRQSYALPGMQRQAAGYDAPALHKGMQGYNGSGIAQKKSYAGR